MSVVINTNTPASLASYNLSTTNANLQRSLNRLSSGSRINSSFDDAAGNSVAMKFNASIKRTDATLANVNNALSFLATQDGVLKNADKILNRISELATLAQDVTKTTADLTLYQDEVSILQDQLGLMLSEQFNGINLFGAGSTSDMTVVTSHDGAQTVGITQSDLATLDTTVDAYDVSTTAGAAAAVIAIQDDIQTLANYRAVNGAQQSRLTFAADMLSINKVNLEASVSRIQDVDVADESTKLARYNILQQAGTAMLAQANQSTQSILRLLS
ncbi:MAG: flagellin [Verrucomicrobia bacterium]|nr:flagellin [Verrucomicrobiota bacterium]